jgi:hypothetical protein
MTTFGQQPTTSNQFTVHVLRLTLLLALLAACSTPPTLTPSARHATLSELLNEVKARASAAGEVGPAAEGQVIGQGGLARTGAESKVRLDLTEGTILRLAPQSEFTLAELNEAAAQPLTRLSLAAGQLWVILSRGELNVETPVGTATVRGSYLGVSFDPGQNMLTATCLEGHCDLSNNAGATALTDGQAAEVIGKNAPPSAARSMTAVEIQEWRQEIPEAQAVLAMPTPAGTQPGGGANTPPLQLTPLPLGSQAAPQLTLPPLNTPQLATPDLSLAVRLPSETPQFPQ